MVKEYLCCSDPLRLTQYCRERFEVELVPSDATKLSAEMSMLHRDWRQDHTSVHCICWLLTRLKELGYFSVTHVDPDYLRLTTELHFWPWEGPEWVETDSNCSDWPTSERRSPLSRLQETEPLNRVARRIVGGTAQPCPYCNQYFRNPNTLVLHISEQHPDACREMLAKEERLEAKFA
jgi:hypothetical protein